LDAPHQVVQGIIVQSVEIVQQLSAGVALIRGAVAEPPAGIEPATYSLRVNRSAD
jgi:hypothetical protein